jgi:hypothetical protein
MTHEFEDFLSRPHTSWTGRTGREQPKDDDAYASPEDGRYKAFGFNPSDDIETCNVAWWLTADTPQGQELLYRFLIRIGYLGDESLHLMLTDCIIHIEGRNLRELRKKLARRRVTYIQAFNPMAWAAPPASEPLIEKITLLYPGEQEPR